MDIEPLSELRLEIQAGWNMIGGLKQSIEMPYGSEEPTGSILPNTLYNWNASVFTYQAQSKLESGTGYWVLAFESCQLNLSTQTLSAPAIVSVKTDLGSKRWPRPELLIPLIFSSQQQKQVLIIGLDGEAKEGLDRMDQPIPPEGPKGADYQCHLVGDQYGLRRDIRPMLDGQNNWQIQLSSSEPVQLTVENQQIPSGQELVISEGQVETVLSAGMEMQLGSGERELTVTLRPLAKVTQLLQNYPNPFNPETWIPYQLNQASEVSLSVYSSEGKLVREIDLGLKPAGNYQKTERAIYWDGRNASGESVSSGVYFYRLQAGDYSQTRKMVILK